MRNVSCFINFKKKWTLLLQHFLLLKRKPGSIFQWGIFFCVFADIENHFYLLKMKYSRKYKISYRKLTVETICKFCGFFIGWGVKATSIFFTVN